MLQRQAHIPAHVVTDAPRVVGSIPRLPFHVWRPAFQVGSAHSGLHRHPPDLRLLKRSPWGVNLTWRLLQALTERPSASRQHPHNHLLIDQSAINGEALTALPGHVTHLCLSMRGLSSNEVGPRLESQNQQNRILPSRAPPCQNRYAPFIEAPAVRCSSLRLRALVPSGPSGLSWKRKHPQNQPKI